MAASSNLTLVNDITLRSVGLMLEDIHERAPGWDERPEDERADFHLEWEGLVGRLEGAIEDDRDGTLTPEQQARLRDLGRELVRSREVIRRIGLDYPDLGHLLPELPLGPDERIAHELHSLRHGAAWLRTLGEVWESSLVDERRRQAFPREWDTVMDRFAKVEALAARGALTPAARAELRRVADELTELLPTMRRLGVRLPDLEALERARSVEAA
jgi:hypothetical protein